MKTRIKKHDKTIYDVSLDKTFHDVYYTVQFKRVLFWYTLRKRNGDPVQFSYHQTAKKVCKHLEQTKGKGIIRTPCYE